jgi:hypothetical protein
LKVKIEVSEKAFKANDDLHDSKLNAIDETLKNLMLKIAGLSAPS